MSILPPLRRSLTVLAVAAGGLALVVPASAGASPLHRDNGLGTQQVNLVSDVPGQASTLDPDLKNPWGLALGTASPLWVANAGTDTSTLYSSAPGATTAAKVPTVRVTFASKPTLPTGQVANNGTGFALTTAKGTGPAKFIFSTITGHIEAWSPAADPLQGDAETKAVVAGASYTGLAEATAKAGDQLYAANFGQNRVDVFDSSFKQVKTSFFAFKDFFLPQGYAPFNVQQLNGNVFVTYAKPDPKTHEAVGKGLGFVDEFTPEGRFVTRIASRGDLNAPWGLAIAPASWGKLAGSLLVGNFGDGKVNVISPERYGRFDSRISGQLTNSATGKPLVIPGLWALLPGTATAGGTDSIWFSAGINHEADGLVGVLRHP